MTNLVCGNHVKNGQVDERKRNETTLRVFYFSWPIALYAFDSSQWWNVERNKRDRGFMAPRNHCAPGERCRIMPNMAKFARRIPARLIIRPRSTSPSRDPWRINCEPDVIAFRQTLLAVALTARAPRKASARIALLAMRPPGISIGRRCASKFFRKVRYAPAFWKLRRNLRPICS